MTNHEVKERPYTRGYDEGLRDAMTGNGPKVHPSFITKEERARLSGRLARRQGKGGRPMKRRYVKIGNYYTVRPQAEPYHVTWQQMALDAAKDAAEVILGVVVFLGLFLGIPFLLWLVAS